MNVPFSHPSGGRPQKDGRKVRSRCRPQSTLAAPPALPRNQPIQMIESGSLPSLRRLAMSKVRPSREGRPRVRPLRRDRFTSAPRSVRFRTEIGPVPRRDRSGSASRSVRFRVEIGSVLRRADRLDGVGGLSRPPTKLYKNSYFPRTSGRVDTALVAWALARVKRGEDGGRQGSSRGDCR